MKNEDPFYRRKVLPPMLECFIPVSGVTTHVLKLGIPSSIVPLVLIIPGNPGVATYYEEFIEELFKQSKRKIAVWCVSHAHHVNDKYHMSNTEPYLNLDEQILHKINFIRQRICECVPIYLVGHSIGSFICLQLLYAFPDQIQHSSLLFPAIERMAVSPRGRRVTFLLKWFRWLMPVAWYLVESLVSSKTLEDLIRHRLGQGASASSVFATQQLLNAKSLGNVLYMANSEMQEVCAAPHMLLNKFIGRLFMYYGAADHWCPQSYYSGMVQRFPSAEIVLDSTGMAHAFCLKSNQQMAKILINRVEFA